MKHLCIFILCTIVAIPLMYSQDTASNTIQRQEIKSLIDTYAEAREKKDTVLLESILASEMDQLVSSGKWRRGKAECMKGMLQSSARNPGSRTLTVDEMRFFDSESAIVDARYQIANTDGTLRKMWSTFVVVYEDDRWKITAIRNMLPAAPQ